MVPTRDILSGLSRRSRNVCRSKHICLFSLKTILSSMGSVELIWNYWTYWEPAKDGEKAGEWILRPWYHRALGSFMQLAFGGFIAGFLLGTRGRHIRKLWLVPPTVPPPADSPARRLALQTLTTFRATAWEAPMEKCTLSLIGDPTVLAIDVEGVKKRFYIQLDEKNNTVLGRQLPLEPAKEEIFRSWYGEIVGRHLLGEGKWKGR